MNDFDRNAWCFLGMPIDVISYQQALDQVSSSALNGQKCFFSTPNLNFIVEASRNDDFRKSVIESDLVLLDGMPPLWIARLLGIPGIEKVSGSDLVEALWNHDMPGGKKIRIFLFGGEEGVAEQASSKINASSRGLECVGFYNPGFGSIDEMSKEAVLREINDSRAEFVLVALGAIKGQAWIMANRMKLDAPVISHLGAVVNFAAGQVARAPRWMQRAGVEWIWRIWQEPGLWRRYFFDGMNFCALLLKLVLPYLVWKWFHRAEMSNSSPVQYRLESTADAITILPEGNCVYRSIDPLREVFSKESRKGLPVTLDLTRVPVVDSAFLGLCMLLHKQLAARGQALFFMGLNPTLRRIFRWNAAQWLL